ncbi:MAG TPA: monovalent cation/H+ antiporter subunit D family protein, partial [Methanothrix sp.]|nr:monovalent cation/H+ antiporter subunit D family protein [Methanothrix sp.]
MIDMMTPLFAISCPAVAAALILLSRRHPNIREAWTIAASIAMFLLVLSMAPLIIRGETVRCILFQSMFKGIYIGFKVDAFGEIFAITASSLWVLVSFYSIGYMRTLKEHAQTRYFFAFCFAIMGAVGVALSANLITLFIFFEVITVSTYPLVIHEQSPEALRAGHKYLAYLMPA